ncbi:MAG: glycine-rich domain-containing protein [Egibacteraceae bacterium]
MSMTTVAAPGGTTGHYGHLVCPTLRQRLVNRVIKDHNLDEGTAAATIDAALGFLKLCADHPDHQFAPSQQVDLGWHTFLLYTREYQAFCEEFSGRFIHHAPDDDLSVTDQELRAVQTVDFMSDKGIPFDEESWQVSARCSSGGSCRYTG